MKIEKLVSPQVKYDLKEAALWYNQAKSGLGQQFLGEVRQEVAQIIKNPLGHEVKYANIRIAFMKRFPYSIHFEYLETEEKLSILAVFHTSRNPRIWKER